MISDGVINLLGKINEPVHLQVFVTPTCPYCPNMVITAQQFALLNEHITADMVEAMEFPEYASKYSVLGVPKTIVNEHTSIDGLVSDVDLLEKIYSAIGKA